MGGSIVSSSEKGPTIRGKSLPPPLRDFVFGIDWGSARFECRDAETLAHEGIVFTRYPDDLEFDRYPRLAEEPFAVIAKADNEAFVLICPLDAPDPTDPPIYSIDWNDFEEECLYDALPLSKFLLQLKRA